MIPSPMSFAAMTGHSTTMIAALWAAIHCSGHDHTRAAGDPTHPAGW